MTRNPGSPTLYLIRHATPDWARTDIPYDVPPGPPLTFQGQQEAQALGVFLEQAGLQKLYHSPLERAAHTAQIAASVAQVPTQEWTGLAEWRHGEAESEIHARFWPLLEASLAESAQIGPVGLVTHGGPVAYLLKQLQIDPARLERQRKLFDHSNPLPPAGAWIVQRAPGAETWHLELIFTPEKL